MWEHKSITDKNFKETGRIQPNETYIQLMDYVETQVLEAQAFALDDEQFLQQVTEAHGKIYLKVTLLEETRERGISVNPKQDS